MKSFVALCLFGVVAAAMAMPALEEIQRPQILPRPPCSGGCPNRPNRPIDPEFNIKPVPALRNRPSHPIGHPEMSPELREFMRDLKDFFKLYPRAEIRRIVREHFQDAELRATIKFVRTAEFKEIIFAIAETPEFQAIAEYFKNADWPWIHRTVVEAINELEADGRLAMSKRTTGGLNALLDDIMAVLPKAELRALFEEKMQTRDVFRSVVEIMTSSELETLIHNAHESAELRHQFGLLKDNGIDMEKIVEYQHAMFGF